MSNLLAYTDMFYTWLLGLETILKNIVVDTRLAGNQHSSTKPQHNSTKPDVAAAAPPSLPMKTPTSSRKAKCAWIKGLPCAVSRGCGRSCLDSLPHEAAWPQGACGGKACCQNSCYSCLHTFESVALANCSRCWRGRKYP